MFQHPMITAARAEQHRTDLMAAAQHARDRRVATRRIDRASGLTFGRPPRPVVPLASTPVPAATH